MQGALARAADLNTAAFWIMGYGIVTRGGDRRAGWNRRSSTPSVVRSRFSGWIERRRATTGGTVLLGVLGLVVGLLFIQNPQGNFEVLVVAGGLWLSYLAVTELVGLIRVRRGNRRGRARACGHRARHLVIAAATVVLVGLVTVGLVVSTRQAGEGGSVGDPAVQRQPGAVRPAAGPGRLPRHPQLHVFGAVSGMAVRRTGEHHQGAARTGVRRCSSTATAFLPRRLPGAGTPLVITDRVASAPVARARGLDPEVVARAANWPPAPQAANAKRAIYLPQLLRAGRHRPRGVLADVKDFLDTNPDGGHPRHPGRDPRRPTPRPSSRPASATTSQAPPW